VATESSAATRTVERLVRTGIRQIYRIGGRRILVGLERLGTI
jgi:hypothetical protein